MSNRPPRPRTARAAQPKRWCYYCRHRGDAFRLPDGQHCHCAHPDPEVHTWGEAVSPDGPSIWATLRRAIWTCDHWEPRDAIGEEA